MNPHDTSITPLRPRLLSTRLKRPHAHARGRASPTEFHPQFFCEATNATRTLSPAAPKSLDLNMDSVGTIRPLGGAQPTSRTCTPTRPHPSARGTVFYSPKAKGWGEGRPSCVLFRRAKRQKGWEEEAAGLPSTSTPRDPRRSPAHGKQRSRSRLVLAPRYPRKICACFARLWRVSPLRGCR